MKIGTKDSQIKSISFQAFLQSYDCIVHYMNRDDEVGDESYEHVCIEMHICEEYNDKYIQLYQSSIFQVKHTINSSFLSQRFHNMILKN